MSAVAYNGNLFGTSFDPWQYSGNVYDNSPAGTTTFPLVTETGNPIDYLKRKHIHVYTSINQGITWTELPKDTSWDFGGQGTEVVLNTGIADGEWIKVQRITPFEDLYIEFQNSSKLTADQLNTGEKFSMFVDQELADGFLALVDRINHGAYVIISETPPTDPIEGQLWWDSNEGFPYIWYEDSTSKQWVRFNPPEQGPPGPPGTTNPADILYTYPGGVEQTVQKRLEQRVSVKDFGAVGDGTTDDTAAIQAAVDALQGTDVVLKIPAGNYVVTRQGVTFTTGEGPSHYAVSITDTLTIVSEGTVSFAGHDATLSTCAFVFNNVVQGQFIGGKFKATDAISGADKQQFDGYAVMMYQCESSLVQEISTLNTGGGSYLFKCNVSTINGCYSEK